MILLWVTKETETRAKMSGAHFQPFDPVNGFGKTQEELEAEGAIFVDELLAPENNGKNGQLFINPQTKEQWYEYTDRPLTAEEEVAQLKSRQADLIFAMVQNNLM